MTPNPEILQRAQVTAARISQLAALISLTDAGTLEYILQRLENKARRLQRRGDAYAMPQPKVEA